MKQCQVVITRARLYWSHTGSITSSKESQKQHNIIGDQQSTGQTVENIKTMSKSITETSRLSISGCLVCFANDKGTHNLFSCVIGFPWIFSIIENFVEIHLDSSFQSRLQSSRWPDHAAEPKVNNYGTD